jgi:DNA-binding FrmR family transcriptional regulator
MILGVNYMMNGKQSKNVSTRLKRIEGQVRGIIKMVEDGRYCIDILSQTRAIASGIRKVEDLIMHQHLQTCVAESMKNDNKEDKEQKIKEIMEVLSKFRRGG